MKKLIVFLAAVMSCTALYSAAVSVELDTRHNKMTTSGHEGIAPIFPLKAPNKDFYAEMRCTQEASLEWKEYSFSFVPSKTGSITIGLSAFDKAPKNMYDWIEYDKIEVINAKLNNTSFEFLSVKGDLWAWRYYNKATPKIGKDDAADGKNYLAVTRSFPARQGLLVTAGKKVTIKFMARSGGMTPREKLQPFFSDQHAPKAK